MRYLFPAELDEAVLVDATGIADEGQRLEPFEILDSAVIGR